MRFSGTTGNVGPVSYRLAVDLGTTFTAAAVAENDGPPVLLGLGNRAMQIPSVLYVDSNGTVWVGETAERRGASDPSRVVRESKRRIGDPVPIMVAGERFTAQALAAKLLSWVVARATQRMGTAPSQVVVTHPANWGPYKLELMEQVLVLADVVNASLMTEPAAAAAQYASRANMALGDRIAVYDLGGGTFDACVLTRSADGFEVLGKPEGIEQLGGIDFDEAIFQHVVSELGGLTDLDPDSEEVVLGLTRLRRECVEAKEALSEDTETTVSLTVPGAGGSVRITRSELESLVRPALLETHAALRRAMRSAGVQADDLSALVLVGGSSRMPIVGQLLTEEFGLEPSLNTHPKHDVALGALQPSHATSHALPGAGTTPPRVPDHAPPPTRPNEAPGSTPIEPPAWLRSRKVVAGGAGAALVVAAAVIVLVSTQDEGNRGRTAPPSATETPSVEPSASVVLPQAPDPLPDSQMLVVLKRDDQRQIWVADTEADAVLRRVTPAVKDAESPVLSPDRKTLVYVRTQNDDEDRENDTLRVIGVDGRGDRRLLPDRSICPEPQRGAWDPMDDGARLVLACGELGDQSIKVVDVDGSNARTLASGTSVRSPAVSPDGEQVVYCAAREPDAPQSIWVVGIGGGTATQLTRGQKYSDCGPVWSPDGFLIAFKRSTVATEHSEIWTMSGDGTNASQLTEGPAEKYAPTWSPDGRQVAFVSSNTDPEQRQFPHIYSIDLGGGEPTEFWPDTGGVQDSPTWHSR